MASFFFVFFISQQLQHGNKRAYLLMAKPPITTSSLKKEKRSSDSNGIELKDIKISGSQNDFSEDKKQYDVFSLKLRSHQFSVSVEWYTFRGVKSVVTKAQIDLEIFNASSDFSNCQKFIITLQRCFHWSIDLVLFCKWIFTTLKFSVQSSHWVYASPKYWNIKSVQFLVLSLLCKNSKHGSYIHGK